MAKVTEYSRVTTLKDNDIFLVDGPDGTRTILKRNAAKDLGGEVVAVTKSGSKDKVTLNLTDNPIDLATENDLNEVADALLPIGTASGNPAVVADAKGGTAFRELKVTIEPVQAGSGDASQDNVREISGWTSASIHVSPDTGSTGGQTYSVTLPDEAGTVYSGILDLTAGTLTVTHVMAEIGTDASNIVWELRSGEPLSVKYVTPRPVMSKGGATAGVISDQYATVVASSSTTDKAIRLLSGAIRIYDNDRFPDEATALASLAANPVHVVYVLNKPIVYQLASQQIAALGGYNAVSADCGPVELTYVQDIKIQDMITEESDGTASRAFTAGEYVIFKGKLYKVTTDISSGAELVPGTNVEETTVGEELNKVREETEEDVSELKTQIQYANHGYEVINTPFVHGNADTSTGVMTESANNYKYQVITPSAITYDRPVTVKCNNGYEFLVFWYDDNDDYVSRTGSWGKSYNVIAGRHIRIFMRLDPNDTSADVEPSVFANNVYVTSEIDYRLDNNDADIAEADGKIAKSNKGQEYVPVTFVNGRMVDNFPVASANNYKYQAVTLEAVTYTRDVTIKANPGYQFTAYWYNDNDEYVSRNASARTEYVMPSGRHFRLYVQLSPPNTSAVVSPETFKDNVYIVNEISERVADIEDNPLTALPSYIKNTLAYTPLGTLSKGYILLSCDDGTAGLATYTIPMLTQKGVPCTFGLLSTSDVITNESYLETLLGALEDGCCVAMHGSDQWPTYTEKTLNNYFNETEAVFTAAGITEVYGAICPGGAGDDTNTLVKAVAGGRFGSVFSRNRANKIAYGDYKSNGCRSNMYDLDRKSAVGFANAAAYQAAIDEAYDNHYVFCPFWHDYSIVDDADKKAIIEGMIDYAKTKGLTFITMKDLPNIT